MLPIIAMAMINQTMMDARNLIRRTIKAPNPATPRQRMKYGGRSITFTKYIKWQFIIKLLQVVKIMLLKLKFAFADKYKTD